MTDLVEALLPIIYLLDTAAKQNKTTQERVSSFWVNILDRLLAITARPPPTSVALRPNYEAGLRVWRRIGASLSFNPDDIRTYESFLRNALADGMTVCDWIRCPLNAKFSVTREMLLCSGCRKVPFRFMEGNRR